jgi:hypothetical protein
MMKLFVILVHSINLRATIAEDLSWCEFFCPVDDRNFWLCGKICPDLAFYEHRIRFLAEQNYEIEEEIKILFLQNQEISKQVTQKLIGLGDEIYSHRQTNRLQNQSLQICRQRISLDEELQKCLKKNALLSKNILDNYTATTDILQDDFHTALDKHHKNCELRMMLDFQGFRNQIMEMKRLAQINEMYIVSLFFVCTFAFIFIICVF